MDLIRAKDLTKTYKTGTTAVAGVNLKIKKGEFCFIIGASGSGKSTLMKMFYREEKPTGGEIIIGGINVGKLRNGNVYKIRRKIGIVFQDYKLLEKLTVFENVAFAVEILGEKKSEVRRKTLEAIELVGLKHKIKSLPSQLSGGEQQRVAIARAIVNGPKLLLCDEPTGNLDPETSMEIVRVLEDINSLGTTVIMATHDREIVNRLKKRVILIDEGKVAKDFAKGTYDHEVA